MPDRRSFMRRFTLSCALAAAVGVLPSVGGWVVMSLIFSWYVTSVADYGSIFGSLATVIVAMEYLYLSSIVFLTGIQVDSLARSRVEGAATS